MARSLPLPKWYEGTTDHKLADPVDFASLFKDDIKYNPAYNTFIDSMPPDGATAEEVRIWLRTWFDVGDSFASDVGVETFLDTIPLTGRELVAGDAYSLAMYFKSGNEAYETGEIYDLDVIEAFESDIYRARIVDAIKRGAPDVKEIHLALMSTKKKAREEKDKIDTEMLSKDMAEMDLKDAGAKGIPQGPQAAPSSWLSNRTKFTAKPEDTDTTASNTSPLK